MRTQGPLPTHRPIDIKPYAIPYAVMRPTSTIILIVIRGMPHSMGLQVAVYLLLAKEF